ncbi:MAG: hypothetical protein Q9165_005673 [Trypethelium subeluteriae]
MAATAKSEFRQADQLATPNAPQLLAFQQPDFDPAEYLNKTLPSLLPSAARSQASRASSAVLLSDLSTQTQSLLAQLNAQTSRLSIILTQLTDEILRTGSRLAYEVEVLRGDTVSLSDTLEETHRTDVAKFLPAANAAESHDKTHRQNVTEDDNGVSSSAARLPPHVAQLKTLTLVRERLNSVIKVFDDAMKWVLPPSELSIASSLISVSTPGQNADEADREQKGREFAETIRGEIEELVAAGGTDNAIGRIEALQTLSQVWKGTAEEKARLKVLDGLVRYAEEKSRSL